jgi:hypothetical protein
MPHKNSNLLTTATFSLQTRETSMAHFEEEFAPLTVIAWPRIVAMEGKNDPAAERRGADCCIAPCTDGCAAA